MVTRYDMMAWHGLITWYDMATWYGMMTWYDMMTRYGPMTRYDVVVWGGHLTARLTGIRKVSLTFSLQESSIDIYTGGRSN